MVELEVRDLLTEYEFPGDDVPVVRGSALGALEGDESEAANILALMEAVDSYIPEPTRDVERPFLMPIEDVFSITGRGTVVTGRVEQGMLETGTKVEIVGIRDLQETTVTGVEMFRKLLDEAQAGDNVGLLLRGIGKEDVERGQVIAAPGSITPHTEFDSQVYVLTKEEGGRHNPFFDGYRPQFYFRTTDVTGSIHLADGTEMVMPGDNTEMRVELIAPIAMDEGCGSRSVRVAAPSAPAASPTSSSKREIQHGFRQETAPDPRLRGVQAAQLCDHQVEEQHEGTPRVEKVLPVVPHPHPPQGNPLTGTG